MQSADQRLEIAMGNMLRIGVTAAALVVLGGGVLYLAQSGGPPHDYTHFRGAPAASEHIAGIFAGALKLDSKSLIEFGILLLIATPIGRVLMGVVGFSFMKDRLYAAISLVVLAILLLSLFSKR